MARNDNLMVDLLKKVSLLKTSAIVHSYCAIAAIFKFCPLAKMPTFLGGTFGAKSFRQGL